MGHNSWLFSNEQHKMPGPPLQSLVKYDTPSLLTTKDKKGSKPAKGGKKLPPVQGKPQLTQTEDILNSILPPREWTEEGQLWVQYVSSTPATRLDVINLQEDLDRKLQQRQARETGICPVREELYAQCFDELIRQVTINCAERGLLLLRVRDELRMTIQAYQTLYESSVAYGLRKALRAQQEKEEIQDQINEVSGESKLLQEQIQELTRELQVLEETEQEKRREIVSKNEEEVQILKSQVSDLRDEL